jgi:hypothetical protein
MKSTTMPRLVKCLTCGYTQKDFVSYYLHAKAWKANHDLEKCREVKSQNAFASMFAESNSALANLTIMKGV